MEPTTLFAFLCLTLVIAFFTCLAVAVWVRNRRREREAYYRNETLKKIAEAQQPAAAAALDFLREQEKIQASRFREGLKLGGLVTIAVGLGLFPLVRAVEVRHPVYVVGLIPLLIGLALLAYVYLLGPKE